MLDLDRFLIPGTLRPLSQRFSLCFIGLTDQSSTKIHPICRVLFQLHHYPFLPDPCETSPTACSVSQTQTPVPFRDFTRDPPRNSHLHTWSLKGSIALADQKLKNLWSFEVFRGVFFWFYFLLKSLWRVSAELGAKDRVKIRRKCTFGEMGCQNCEECWPAEKKAMIWTRNVDQSRTHDRNKRSNCTQQLGNYSLNEPRPLDAQCSAW